MPVVKTSLFSLTLLLLVAFSPSTYASDQAPATTVWTVQQAVRFALTNSPDSRITKQRIAAAQAMVRQARAPFYPRLGVSSQYSRTNTPMYSFGNILNQGKFNQSINFNDPGRTDDLNMAAHLDYRLYNGGRSLAGLTAAKEAATAAARNSASLQNQLAFQVVRSFFSIVQAGETMQARQSQAEAINASLAVAQARFAAGALLRSELLNLEVQEAGAKENLIRSRHAQELAKRGFLNLLGLASGTVIIDPLQDNPVTPPPEATGAGRPELQSLDAMILAAKAKVRQAEGDRYPTADAFASYQVDKGYEISEDSGNSWLAGIKMNYTLFEGNRSTAALAEARVRLNEVKEQRRKLQLAISLEIEQAKLALRQAEERLQVTAKMVELAEENARLNRERFKEGVVLSSDLIEVENRLTDARVRQVVAKASHRISLADLRRALGLPQFEEPAGPGAIGSTLVDNNQNKGGGE